MSIHVAKKIVSGVYAYRGYVVVRDESVSAGYWGAWDVDISTDAAADSLRNAKRLVDQHIDRIGKESDQAYAEALARYLYADGPDPFDS